jgi:uncharacterized protein (TIGR02246 family)
MNPEDSLKSPYIELNDPYQKLLKAWNDRSPDDFVSRFAEDDYLIGFDGSQVEGSANIASHLRPIFADHPTARHLGKGKSAEQFCPEIAIPHAVAGMIPPGRTEIEPKLNIIHTIVAVKLDSGWRIKLFQNTPAQFHGRPELVQELTEELSQLQ